jgi:hypothetical protein
MAALLLAILLGGDASAFTLNSVVQRGWHGDVLRFSYNMTGCPITEAEMTAAIDAAVDVWNTVPTSRVTLERGGTTTATSAQASSVGAPLIVCDTAMSTTLSGDSNNIPAATGVGSLNQQVVYAYILLNAESGKSANVGNLSATKLALIMAHEIGHALGLGHTSNTSALMYFDATAKTQLSLAQDDMDGITYLYPREEGGGGKPFACSTVDAAGPGGGGAGRGAEFATLLAAAWVVTVLARRREAERA